MQSVLLGLGSNSNAKARLENALSALETIIVDLSVSPWYESHALNGGANYLNLVVRGQTELDAEQLLFALRDIEQANGRERDSGILSCALDIDLLCYNRITITTADVELPRRDILNHAHVLLPLSQLCPEEQHPTLGLSYERLWEERKTDLLSRQTLWKID